MSFQSVSWACKARTGSSTLKLLLIALAQFADARGCAWPCIATLLKCTELNRKTIITGLQQLEALGLLADTGERKGRTSRVKVYRLVGVEVVDSLDDAISPKNGTIPRSNATVPKSGPLSVKNGSNSAREIVPFLDGNGPKNGTQNSHEYSEEKKTLRGDASIAELSIDRALFADARKIFGPSIGGQINRAIKLKGKGFVLDVMEACRRKDPEAARAYLAAALRSATPNPADRFKTA